MNSNLTELAICHYHSLNTLERNQIKKSLKKMNPKIQMKIIKNSLCSLTEFTKGNYLKNYFKGYTCTFYSNSYQILDKSFISFIKRQPSLLLLELVVPGKDISPLYSNYKTFSINHLDAQKLSEKEILYTQLLKQKQLPIIQSLYVKKRLQQYV